MISGYFILREARAVLVYRSVFRRGMEVHKETGDYGEVE